MRWEYRVHTLNAAGLFSSGHVTPREMQDVLNEHGALGWELVSVCITAGAREGGNVMVLTFKRPAGPSIPVSHG